MVLHARVAGLLRRPSEVNYVKRRIPKALREQVWLHNMGHIFEGKCKVVWCTNVISAFDFQAGHNIPESKGGKTNIGNLIPICTRCNISMGNTYSIDEWNSKFSKPTVIVAPDPPVRRCCRIRCWWC